MLLTLRHRGKSRRRQQNAIIGQQQMPAALARIDDDLAFPRQYLLQRFQIKPRLIGTGGRAKSLLSLDKLAGIALRAILPSDGMGVRALKHALQHCRERELHVRCDNLPPRS